MKPWDVDDATLEPAERAEGIGRASCRERV